MTERLLQVRHLVKHFRSGGFFHSWKSSLIRAVDGIDLTVCSGEAVGLVGESGCGKSTTGRILLGLIPPTAGEVLLAGRNLSTLRGTRKREVYRDIQGVFQDPLSSMNPRMTVEEIITEPLIIHNLIKLPKERRQWAGELLNQVGLPASVAARFPHQCSGGQRQRVALARALAVKPRFIVFDEPLSALDISVQAQMINLLQELKSECGLSYLLISHDLRAVRFLCDRVAVMYLGKILETGPAAQVLGEPAHPYTRALLAAIPMLDEKIKKPPAAVTVETTNAAELLNVTDISRGCRFRTRCPQAAAMCAETGPELKEIISGHAAACHML